LANAKTDHIRPLSCPLSLATSSLGIGFARLSIKKFDEYFLFHILYKVFMNVKQIPEPPLPPKEKQFYYASQKTSRTEGPVALDALRQLAATGVISHKTPVIEEGAQQWSSWGDMLHSESVAKTAAATVEKVKSLQAQSATYSWGDFMVGVLLVITCFLLIPWQLIKKSADDLCEWGRTNSLPTSLSDIPTLTALCIVPRPIAHFIWTLACPTTAIHSAFSCNYEPTTKLGIVTMGILMGYFGNIIVGLAFDCAIVSVSIANNLKQITQNLKKQ